MLPAALVALVLSAAPLPPELQAASAKFPALTAPFDVPTGATQPLDPKLFEPVLKKVKAFRITEGTSLSAAGRTTFPGGVTGLFVHVSLEGGMQTVEEVWLLTFAKGEPRDAVMAGGEDASEAGGFKTHGRVEKDGTVRLTQEGIIPIHDIPDANEMKTGSVATMRVRPDGKIERGTDEPTSLEGRFDDGKSGEVLFILDGGRRIVYRAKEAKPNQELKVVAEDAKARTATVQFAKAKGSYGLTWQKDGKAITCRNPDGTVQTFARVW